VAGVRFSGVAVLEASLAQWSLGVLAPGVATGLVAHLWISSPVRARGNGRWPILAGAAFLLLGYVLCPAASSEGASWAWLARIAAAAWLTVAVAAVPRVVRRLGERRIAAPAASPYRTGRAIAGPSVRAYAEERVSWRLAFALTVIAGVGGLAWAPASPGWSPWHEPAATR
jgi:hypothetical protein